MTDIKINCPFCVERVGKRDTKRKLWINPAKNMAHCWRCGYGSRDAAKLAVKLGLSPHLLWGIADPLAPSTGVTLPPEFRTDFRSTPIGNEAWSYLFYRGVPPVTIAAYNIGYCITGRCAGRVLIPVYQQETLVNYQARALCDTVQPRYLGPSTGATPGVPFNLDRPAGRGVLLLVEGMFDALRIPQYGVALLGKGWNDTKRQHVLRTHPHTVFICLDADARADEQNIFEDLSGVVPHVASVQLDAKDLGSASAAALGRVRQLCQQAELDTSAAALAR